jgi:prepilin-type N-terminal cleavage/methylation domain-containing protein
MDHEAARSPMMGQGGERPRGALRSGFTLVELLVVIVIIGIILTFILIAAQDARRRAEEAATQSLIVKLEGGINDRLDALLQTRPDYNLAHDYVADVWTNDPATGTPTRLFQHTRAQVIAWYDFIKSEVPDVFFVQNTTGPYPLNFAADPFPGTPIDRNGTLGNYMLPLGNGVANAPPNSYGAGNVAQPMGTGIFGASYFAAAGIYKNLGYLPQGYDGIDNDGNGYIDDWAEGTQGNQAVINQVQFNLGNHKHHTARAEMLYAMLVEGVGPLGSVFSRDDFTDAQVKDTDSDGLPEFVDAWGNPLQFFRWPLLFSTDTQRGQVIDHYDFTTMPPTPEPIEWFNPPYKSVFEARETAPLDPNNLLVSPAWWFGGSGLQGANTNSPFATLPGPAGTVGGSGGVIAFEYFFHRLTEPFQHTGNFAFYWDRGNNFPYRRAFFSKPLILSSGPDGQPGVFLFPDAVPPTQGSQLLMIENNAIPFDPALFSGETIPAGTTVLPNSTSWSLRDAGKDDITNQNRQTTGGVGGS